MAMIAIPVSPDVSRLFREIDVDGHRDSSDHITLFYLGENLKMDTILDIIPILNKVAEDLKPFDAMVSRITTFPKGEESKEYPVIAEVKCEKLLEIREKIRKMLDKNKIDYDDTYSEYKPHITLSYFKKKQKNIRLPVKAKFMINQIALFGGDEADSRIFVNFPFSLGVEKNASDKLLDLSEEFLKAAEIDS
jgi:2'-5' RNA ligase